MRLLIFLFPILLFVGYSKWGNYSNYKSPVEVESFNPISATTSWSFQGKLGKTLDGDSVTTWTDQVASQAATAPNDTTKPKNYSTYLSFEDQDFVSVAANATLFNLGTDDFTLSGKFRATNTENANYICTKYINTSDSYMFYAFSDDLRLFSETGNVTRLLVLTEDVSNLLSDNTDYTFSVVCDRDGTAQIYLNGSPVTTTTTTMSTTALNFNTTFNIGGQRATGNLYLTGRIYWLQLDSGFKDATWALNFHNYLVTNGY